MAFIIPNAGDTAGGNKYANINQAEPDSLDMEALGNMLTACIRSGGEVTNSGNTINIAAGVAIFGGVPYPFNSWSYTNTAAVGGSAFTAVVVRLSGGSASVVKLDATSSSTNPTLPKSSSTLTGSYNSSTDYSPVTDVLLASVLRGSDTTSKNIVDKRIVFTGSLHWTQATAPTVAQGNNGDLVTVGSTVYVKAAGAWLLMATQPVVDDIVPVGGILTWPSLRNPPSTGTRWLECNGQSVSSTTYPALAAAWGVAGTFVIPNYANLFLRGSTISGTGIITNTGGSNTSSVPLKDHSHTMNNHSHTFPEHDHTATTTGSDGGHGHTAALNSTAVTVNPVTPHIHPVSSQARYANTPGLEAVGVMSVVRQTGVLGGGYTIPITTTTITGNPVDSKERAELIPAGGSGITSFGVGTDQLIGTQAGEHSHTAAVNSAVVNVSGQGTHGHTITVSTRLAAESSGPSSANTSVSGEGAAPTVDTVPAFRSVRFFVRAV